MVPVHALLKAREIEYVLQDSGARMLICAAPLLKEGAGGAASTGTELLTVMAPDDGGLPRLEAEQPRPSRIRSYVPWPALGYRNPSCTPPAPPASQREPSAPIFALVKQTSVILTSVMDFKPGDVLFGGLPLFHTFGQTVVLNAGAAGGRPPSS